MHNVSDVRQIEVYTVEPLVPGPSRLEVETAIAKLKRYKSPGSDQIPAKLIQAEVKHPQTLQFYLEKDLSDRLKESIIITVHKRGDKTD
jgi:hypothetical protein